MDKTLQSDFLNDRQSDSAQRPLVYPTISIFKGMLQTEIRFSKATELEQAVILLCSNIVM